MDHLLIPHGEVLGRDDNVRHASTEAYDKGPFLTYSQRNPRLKPVEEFHDDIKPFPGVKSYFSKNVALLEDLLQTWLFFGLLYEFFGDDMKDEDFIDSQRGLIHTSNLLPVTRRWLSRAQDTSVESRQRLADCLRRTHGLLYVTNGTDFDENIRFSIVCTAELLDRALKRVSNEDEPLGIPWALAFWSEERSLGMKQHGWCPYEAALLETRGLSLCTLFFLSRMRKAKSLRDHSNCSSDLCLFSERAKRDLKYPGGSNHRTKSCTCREVELSPNDTGLMVDLLDRGVVPLAQINLAEDGTPSLRIVEPCETTRYVAISHVFADGLGNRLNNSLPGCQLTYLHEVIASLEAAAEKSDNGRLLLWIDTLCFPASSERSRPNALTLMRQTYKEAEHVLILDAELENINIDRLPVLEQSARFLTSTWMLRLWTLQEAVLASSLWVQFASGAVNLQKVYYDLQQEYERYERLEGGRRAIFRELISSFQMLRENLADGLSLSLQLLASAVRNRIISDPADEPLCIATLLNLDVGSVASVPSKERMRALWNMLASRREGIPRSIIFHEGEKLQFPGYCWAPSTLLEARTGLPMSLSWPGGAGYPISTGLLVHFPGARISGCSPPDGIDVNRIGLPNPRMIWSAPDGKKYENLFLRYASGTWSQLLAPRTGSNSSTHAVGLNNSNSTAGENTPYLHDMLQQEPNKYALILRDNKTPGTKGGHQSGRSTGLLVALIREEEGVSIVQKVRNVTLEHQDPEMCTKLELAIKASQSIRDSEEVKNYAAALAIEPGSSPTVSRNVSRAGSQSGSRSASQSGLRADSQNDSRNDSRENRMGHTRRDALDALQKALGGALKNFPFAETPAERHRLVGMAFQALLGRYAVLEPWSEPTKAWVVD